MVYPVIIQCMLSDDNDVPRDAYDVHDDGDNDDVQDAGAVVTVDAAATADAVVVAAVPGNQQDAVVLVDGAAHS